MRIENVIKHLRSFILAQSARPQKSRRAMMIWGSPGGGKSTIISDLAEQEGWGFTELRLSDLDPTDITGLPARDGNRAVFLRPDLLPREDDDRIHVLLVDEVTNSPPSMASIFSRVALTGMAGVHRLPKKCVVIGAGNRASDRAAARDMPRHNANRLDHITLEINAESTARFGDRQGWPASVTGFIRRFPGVLNYDPADPSPAFASPRSMESLADFLRFEDGADLAESRLERIEGIVGQSCAAQFIALEGIIQDLPLPSEIWNDPHNARVPENVGARYVLASALSAQVSKATMPALVEYAPRMGADMEMLVMRAAIARDGNLANCAAYVRWSVKAQKAFM